MAECSTLKLIIEKGPRAGDTLTYSSPSIIKVGRVVKGNTISIKDAGISSNHIRIQYDNQLTIWTLCDLDSSNGTVLNAQILKPHVPSVLNDGDCIKIGELTSIIVEIGADSAIRPRRNPSRQGKSGSESGPAAVVKKEMVELGLGFDGDLGVNEVKKPIQKRNMRGRGKKAVDLKNEVESLSTGRVLRSSKKLEQIPEDMNVDAISVTGCSVSVQPRMTRGRKRMADPDVDERKPVDNVVLIEGKRTRGRRKALRVDDGNEAAFDKISEAQLENTKKRALGENLDTKNESAEDHLVSPQKDCEGKEAGDGSEYRKDGTEGVVKDTGVDYGRWKDLEKMTLADFFDYLEVQLPKEIYEKSEKIISDLEDKARKFHEFKLQRNENGKGKGNIYVAMCQIHLL